MLPVYTKNTRRQAKSPVVKTGRQVSVLTSEPLLWRQLPENTRVYNIISLLNGVIPKRGTAN